MRNLQLPGRSPVRATEAMAATSHPLATAVALDILRAGGNALDAAVAACAVQGVVEPQSTGIGGDCFALIAPGGSDQIVAYNGSGRAPAAARAEWFLEQGIAAIERQTPHAVTVPGAVEAWARLVADHGTMSLGDLLAPAIAFARDGYPIHDRVAFDMAAQVEALSLDPTAKRLFLPGGRPPAAGDMHRQPELAETLSRIAEEGPDGFYKGSVAEDMVGLLRHLGGLHTLEDFAAAAGEYVTPISTDYRGHRVFECPPNGQGMIALEMLNILSGFDFAGLDPLSTERLHLEIEVARLAHQDRDSFLADPAQADVPVQRLLSEDYAAAQRGRISPDKAMTDLPPPAAAGGANTVYLCVVDKDRNAVSFINSLFNSFGSGFLSPRTGVMLHSRGQSFRVEPGHPNCIAPGKRPYHTIIPGMLVRDGRAVMPFGVMGAHYQAQGQTHLLTNLLDFGLDVQEAIDLARVQATPQGDIEVEEGVPAAVQAALSGLGHRLVAPDAPIGGAQAIQIDWDKGTLTGGSDPRKDGCALGY